MFSSTFLSSPSDQIVAASVSDPHHVNWTKMILMDVIYNLYDFFYVVVLSICNQDNIPIVILHFLINFRDLPQSFCNFSIFEISFKSLNALDSIIDIYIIINFTLFIHFLALTSETDDVEDRIDR